MRSAKVLLVGLLAIAVLSTLSCAYTAEAAPTVTQNIDWSYYGFTVTIQYPETAELGENFNVYVELATGRDLYFTVDVSLIYGEGRFTEWARLVENQRVASGMSVSGSHDFTIPDGIRSGPVYIWLEVKYIDGVDYESIRGMRRPADIYTIIAGPYIEAGDLEQLRQEYLSLQQSYSELEQAYQQLQQDYSQLQEGYNQLMGQLEAARRELSSTRMYIYGIGALTVVLAILLAAPLILKKKR